MIFPGNLKSKTKASGFKRKPFYVCKMQSVWQQMFAFDLNRIDANDPKTDINGVNETR